MIYYHLSSRQLATLENGESLRVALPITYDFPADGSPAEQRQWFVDSLPNAPVDALKDFEAVALWAHLSNRGGSLTNDPESMTLATRLGELVDERNREKIPCYPVQCFIATVAAEGEKSKRCTKPPRWPGGRMVYVKRESD
jgi:hypothetical protein